jgi:nucleoside 2-deoxyribosyltransferase
MFRIIHAGHTLTYDWTSHPDTTDTEVFRLESVEDLQGVKDAHILIYLHPGRFGSAAELGAALALDKPVIIVGEVSKLDSVYFSHPHVRFVATISDAIKEMQFIKTGGGMCC